MSPDRQAHLVDAALRCASALGPWFFWLGLPMAGLHRREPRC
jgi:hypothetical protein